MTDSVAVAVHRLSRWTIVSLFIVALASSTAPAQAKINDSPVAAGRLRGTMAYRSDARDSSSESRVQASGAATWRLETDTLDWRRKVTLRLTLDGPDSVRYVIMTASADAPGPLLHRKQAALSHVDPTLYIVSMSARELGRRRSYDDWGWEDTLAFEPAGSPLPPGAVLRGRLHLVGFHVAPSVRDSAGRQVGRVASRFVDVTFAATFDPRPSPTPASMTLERQQRIMWAALEEYAERWMQGGVNPVAIDSTRSNALARALLTSRWRETATVDSIAVSAEEFYVRLRGRFIPVTCEVTSRSSAPRCQSRTVRARPARRT